MSEESLKFPLDHIKDPEIKLQLIFLQDKGSGALSPDKAAHVRQLLYFILLYVIRWVLRYVLCKDTSSGKLPKCFVNLNILSLCFLFLNVLVQLSKVMSEMNTIYSTATVCLNDDPFNCQTLEPGTTLLLKTGYGDVVACYCRPKSDKAVYN